MNQTEAFPGSIANVNLRQVGKNKPRNDAPTKVHGKAIYAGDFYMEDMLFAKVLHSDRASANIRNVDISAARALRGVHSVLTAADLTACNAVMTDLPGQTGGGTKDTTQPILAADRVRFHGEPIALIAAESYELAQQALDLIVVDYEDTEGVYDPFDSQKPGAAIVYSDDNIVADYKIRKGDIEKGFDEADYVLQNTFTSQYQEQAFMEPEAAVAWVDEHEILNIRSSTQVVEHFRAVANALGIPHNRVHLQAPYIGGGFGGKEVMTIEVWLALLAMDTKRPVKLIQTRENSFLSHGPRHPFTITHKTGVTKDGKVTAMKIKLTSDAGAYAKLSPYILLYATVGATGPYRVDNLWVDATSAATNNLPACAFRGFGTMQANTACEAQMEEIAKLIGMDSLELRRKNFIQPGDPNTTGQIIRSSVWCDQCATQALAALGEQPSNSEHLVYGHGIACYQQSYGRIRWMKDTSESWVGLEMDGTAIVRCAVTDIGAGQMSALAQITGEILGVPMDEITVYFGDGHVNPLAGTSTASRALYMSGKATELAARAVRDNLLQCMARHFEVSPDELDLADSTVFVLDNPERRMSIKDMVKLCAAEGVHRHNLSIFKAPPSEGLDPETGQGEVFPDFTYGAHAAQVSVDIDTGEVTVIKSVGAHDVGQAINLRAVEGQIEGSALMGQGFALSEELILEKGVLKNGSFSEYLIPTSEDVPEIQSIVLESRSGLGPFGSKGIGEPVFAPVAASIANAVADAIGTRIHDLPLTPEKVLRAINENKASR
ncbi:MAG: xanthine dehydrogenase family protein molybdopterin-binding subunit [Gammaproteobacteria bacterium]|nr:xanthine dehydrogenase family protein molybdopterin-binding subunit [Gammaproteobacteria bacterium]